MNCILNSNEKTVQGTVMKFGIMLILPCGLVMDDVDFTVRFFVYTDADRVKTFDKLDMERISDNNYVVDLDTSDMGAGKLQYQIDVTLPDGRIEKIKGITKETLYDGVH
jgi:hypothetical protein